MTGIMTTVRTNEHFWILTEMYTYTRGLRKLPPDVDELVLQGFLFELQLSHSQRLVMVQLHLLMCCHQCFL